jgi:hypothetical protein
MNVQLEVVEEMLQNILSCPDDRCSSCKKSVEVASTSLEYIQNRIAELEKENLEHRNNFYSSFRYTKLQNLLTESKGWLEVILTEDKEAVLGAAKWLQENKNEDKSFEQHLEEAGMLPNEARIDPGTLKQVNEILKSGE